MPFLCERGNDRVIKTGDWNTGQGPDFQGAELVIGERNCKGDIEVHLRSSDFRGHQHDRDFAYNNTILHIFLSQNDESGETSARIAWARTS